MTQAQSSRPVLKFGVFEADLRREELRKRGVKAKLQEQPFRVLALLLERPGEVVTRQDLQKRLWPSDTFVDFENGLNTAIRKLREALGDDSENPEYIETVPRHGYRFIAPVTEVAAAHTALVQAAVSPAAAPRSSWLARGRYWIGVIAIVLVVLGVAGWELFRNNPAFSFNSQDSVLVTDFENHTGDPRFNNALDTAFTVSLEQSRHANVFPRARLGEVLKLMGRQQDSPITAALGREICQRESIRGMIAASITRTGNEFELSAELIDPQSGSAVRSYSERAYGEDHILDALDVIAREVRADLGESLYQIHRANKPLPQVTTSSLAALKDYADGLGLWHSGKYQDAVTIWRAAIDADPSFAMAHAALGDAYYSYIYNLQDQGKQEYEKALADSSRTTDREKMTIEAMYAADQGHVDDADSLYRAYLRAYPDDWTMLSNYAWLLRMHGRAPQAIQEYKQILRVAPDDARTYEEMATAYSTMDSVRQALQAYAKAFQLDPDLLSSGDIGREYGFLLVESGDEAKAMQVFSSLANQPKTREAGIRSLGLLDEYHGRYASAQRRFEDALAMDERDSGAPLSVLRIHLWLAILARGEGDVKQHRLQIDEAMKSFGKISPKVPYGALLGAEYARAGEISKAQALEKQIALLADPRNAEVMSYLHLLQGEIALVQDHADNAISLLTSADQENSSALTVDALARAYQQAGKMDQAIAEFQSLLKVPHAAIGWEPEQAWLSAHCTLAQDYLVQHEEGKAARALQPLLDLWKDADANLPLRKESLALEAKLAQPSPRVVPAAAPARPLP
jgi:DNA-binding winged helix-turn-helix (wHTH) protein/tetratricopeptide (TPR) repeat protein